jgi:predicted transcriptional regulator
MFFQVEHLAPAIRSGRNALNWTQKDLAEKSEISLPTINRLEDQKNPKMATVLALLRVLGNHGVVFQWHEQGFSMNVNFLQKELTATD